ncbi:MAG: hypothetical protein U0610_15145 [bacterium]
MGPSPASRPRRTYRYSIDFEGRVFHAGTEIADAAVIRQLLAVVRRDEAGGYYSLCAGERNELAPADALYVIASFADAPSPDRPAHLPVTCQGGLERRLALDTLRMRGDAFLYGDVDGGFAARFGRHAWLDFALRHVDSERVPARARFGDASWPIKTTA